MTRKLLLTCLLAGCAVFAFVTCPDSDEPTEQVSTPFFDPMPITYNNPVDVEIKCLTEGAVIHYTIDGSDPTLDSPVYAEALRIESNTMIKAFAILEGYLDSSAITANYKMQVAPPIFDLAPVVYNNAQSLMMICMTDGADIYYTTDGDDPTAASTQYLSPINIAETMVIKAIGVKTGMADSKIVERNYNFKAGTPQFNPLPGTFNYGVSVTLNCSSPGATIYYTVNGNTPTTASTVYTEGIAVTGSTTFKAKAFMPGGGASSVVTAVYTINSNLDIDVTLYAQRLMAIDIFSSVNFSNEDTKWLVSTVEAGQGGVYYLAWSDSEEGAGGDTIDALVTLYQTDKTTPVGGIEALDLGYNEPKSILLSPGNYYLKVTGDPAGSPVTGSCRIKLYR